VSDAANPEGNVFNSSRSAFGATGTAVGDLPQLTGQAASLSGLDLDVFDVTAQVPDGATSLAITTSTTQDTYFLAGVLLATPTTAVPVELQSFSVE
jgi:hypothetical protein